ncbi:hypothetical protein [Desulfobotulus mexicanus]|uniref:Uncharacterized protein n=1 Tax=Desulfobotulus mexicanus TaxID=2586642 RepID=A0A5Q4VH83_9BACT|nr:hypothetical protein [Desulfobotulus mexicanus]TYT76196.1 hypothetical protein FIM25_01185 [Desulfobotulus mexicanus]
MTKRRNTAWVAVQQNEFRNSNPVIAAASCFCKAPWLYASDIAIVSDQSLEGLCERSGKLSELPQGSVLKPAMVIKKLILPVAASFCRFRTGQEAPE